MSVAASEAGFVGSGAHRYRMVDDWAQLPPDYHLNNDVAAVAIDRADNVYVFNRGPHPVMVFDREGRFLRSWGEGVFTRPHGAHIAPDESLYLTDDGDHTVRKFTLDGKLLLTIGTPHQPAPFMGLEPFNRCTHTALSPSGDIFVSDGYGNAAVHKYTPDGRLLKSWGGFGTDPGEFALPHNILCDADGYVYVADRENHRVQVFTSDGRYETQWNNMARPCGLFMTAGSAGASPLCYIGELGPAMKLFLDFPNIGPRISITDLKGAVVARLGRLRSGTGPGAFIAPHGIAVDSRGDIYVGEVAYTMWDPMFPDTPKPPAISTLKKLVKL